MSAHAAAPAAEALPAPKVAFTVAAGSPKQWTMRLENTGDVPLRIVADPYLLSLEIMVPAAPASKGKKASPARTVRCALPADMRPTNDGARGLVLLPGKAYKETIDPRMYCFGTRESPGLVRGARVVAHYGFAPANAKKAAKNVRATAPFAVAPIPTAERPSDVTLASMKEVIASSAIELTDEDVTSVGNATSATSPDNGNSVERVASPSTSPVSAQDTAGGDGGEHPFEIALPARSDGFRGRDLSVSVTLTNVGARRTAVYFRPQSVAFDVTGPEGEFTCPAVGAGAIRELFTSISPRGRAQISMLVASACPDHAFDLPGLYEVRPRLDTRHIAESPAALHAFEGQAVGNPALLRVRAGKSGTVRPPPALE